MLFDAQRSRPLLNPRTPPHHFAQQQIGSHPFNPFLYHKVSNSVLIHEFISVLLAGQDFQQMLSLTLQQRALEMKIVNIRFHKFRLLLI